METKQKVVCPNCGTPIDVQEMLSHQAEETLRRKINEEANQWKKTQEQKLKEQFTKDAASQFELLQKELN